MVWVIEHRSAHGDWLFCRHPDGQPMWYSFKAEADRAMSQLKLNNHKLKLRLQHIKD
jgi:hypothetical protein